MTERPSDESGQALVMALLAMAIGVLLISGFLYFASTSQHAVRSTQAQTINRYSADAGVEHALWRIKNQPAFRQALFSSPQAYTQMVNNHTVAISVTQTLTSPVGGGGGTVPPLYDVRVEPDQGSFVLPSGSSHTYELNVINAGQMADSFRVSIVLDFNTSSGRVVWTVAVRDGTGTTVYGPTNFDPPRGAYSVSLSDFHTTPLLNPGQAEAYEVIITKGPQGGRDNTLDVTFSACSVGAAAQSPPEVVCDTSILSTSVESQNTPAIGLRKTAVPATVAPGERITYTVTAENAGDGDADTVEVVDTLPAKTEARFVVGSVTIPGGTVDYSDDNGATWNYTPAADSQGLDGTVDAIRWTLTDVVSGASANLIFSVQVNKPYTSTATLVHNEAQALWWKGGNQYGPTTTSFNNRVMLPPIYRVTAAVAQGTTVVAYAEFTKGNVRVVSWEIK